MDAGDRNDLLEKCGVKDKGIKLGEVIWILENKDDDVLRDNEQEEIEYHEEII